MAKADRGGRADISKTRVEDARVELAAAFEELESELRENGEVKAATYQRAVFAMKVAKKVLADMDS